MYNCTRYGFWKDESYNVLVMAFKEKVEWEVRLYCHVIKIRGLWSWSQRGIFSNKYTLVGCVLQEVDTAIIKLQAEGDSSDLLRFLDHSDIACNLPECTQWLLNHKQYSALAKLHRQDHNSTCF